MRTIRKDIPQLRHGPGIKEGMGRIFAYEDCRSSIASVHYPLSEKSIEGAYANGLHLIISEGGSRFPVLVSNLLVE